MCFVHKWFLCLEEMHSRAAACGDLGSEQVAYTRAKWAIVSLEVQTSAKAGRSVEPQAQMLKLSHLEMVKNPLKKKKNPSEQQNLINCSFGHSPPIRKISTKSNFLNYLVNTHKYNTAGNKQVSCFGILLFWCFGMKNTYVLVQLLTRTQCSCT